MLNIMVVKLNGFTVSGLRGRRRREEKESERAIERKGTKIEVRVYVIQ